MLRDTREEKGLTLDEISKALLIKKPVISAIEAGDWENLPPPVYVKGYVNQYAALLKVVDLLEAEMTRTESPPPPEAEGEAAEEGKERAPKGWTPKKTKITAAVAAGAIVVLAFVVFLNLPRTTTVSPPAQSVESTTQPAQTTESTAQPAQSVESATQPAQTTPNTEAPRANEPKTAGLPAKPSPAPAEQSESVEPAPEPKKLTIACQERTWVRIVIDGQEEKEFTLNPEEVVKLDAKESFDLLVGNAGGVKLFYNGIDTGFSGEEGEVKHVRLP